LIIASNVLNALLIRPRFPLILIIHFIFVCCIIRVCLVVSTNVSSDLASTSSISNNILGNVISTVATGDMFASAATLNPGQDLYCAEQLQGTQETRSPWHPAGIPATISSFTPSIHAIRERESPHAGCGVRFEFSVSEHAWVLLSNLEYSPWPKSSNKSEVINRAKEILHLRKELILICLSERSRISSRILLRVLTVGSRESRLILLPLRWHVASIPNLRIASRVFPPHYSVQDRPCIVAFIRPCERSA